MFTAFSLLKWGRFRFTLIRFLKIWSRVHPWEVITLGEWHSAPVFSQQPQGFCRLIQLPKAQFVLSFLQWINKLQTSCGYIISTIIFYHVKQKWAQVRRTNEEMCLWEILTLSILISLCKFSLSGFLYCSYTINLTYLLRSISQHFSDSLNQNLWTESQKTAFQKGNDFKIYDIVQSKSTQQARCPWEIWTGVSMG